MQRVLTITRSEKLRKRLSRYAKRAAKEDLIVEFSFTENYGVFKGRKGVFPAEGFDAVLIDCSVGRKGFAAADDLRKADKRMPVVFAESGAEKIGIGYIFNAVAYIVYDAFAYSVFKLVFQRTAELASRESDKIAIRNNDGVKIAYRDDIMYLEIAEHTLTFHLVDDTLSCRASLKPISDRLLSHGFEYCSRGCLVNLRYVSEVGRDTVTLKDPGGNEISLEISKARRKPLCDSLESRYGFVRDFVTVDLSEVEDEEDNPEDIEAAKTLARLAESDYELRDIEKAEDETDSAEKTEGAISGIAEGEEV